METLCLSVKYQLAQRFRSLVELIPECKVVNVVEVSNCKILQYIIHCPKEQENLIVDYAFMTWIKNPVFQKYYGGTKEFDQISDDYIKERMETCIVCGIKTPLITLGGECETCLNKRLFPNKTN